MQREFKTESFGNNLGEIKMNNTIKLSNLYHGGYAKFANRGDLFDGVVIFRNSAGDFFLIDSEDCSISQLRWNKSIIEQEDVYIFRNK